MKEFQLGKSGKCVILMLLIVACGALPLQAQPLNAKFPTGVIIKTQLSSIESIIDSAPLRARRELKLVLPLLEQTNYGQNWGKYHELSGNIAVKLNEPDVAVKSFFSAIEAFKKSRNYSAQGKIYLAIGEVFHQQWQHQKSIEYFQTGLNILNQYPEKSIAVQIQILEQLGRCNLELTSYQSALNYLMQAQVHAKRSNNQPALVNILQLMAQAYSKQRRYELARQVLEEARGIANKESLQVLEMKILKELCLVNLKFENYNQAKFFALKKRTIAQALHDTTDINLGNYLLAEAYLAENLLDSALSYNRIALNGTLGQGDDKAERDIWVQQSTILANLNQAYPAVIALEKAQQIEDKIASNTQRLRAEKARQEMAIDRTEEETQQQLQAQLEQERQTRYAMFFILFLAALISLYYLFKVRIRQKANQLLKFQNAQLESQKNQLGQLSQVKDQLFAVISHDLRSPLLAIQAVLDTLNEPDLADGERKNWLERLHLQTAKTSLLLENLLYWAKIQMNSYLAVKEEFKLHPIVEDLSESIQFIFAEKGVRIKNEIAPELALYSDPGMIRMALRNIIANAVKFSHAGQTVEVYAWEDQNNWVIQVKDHGIGMNEEQLNKALNGQLSRFGTKGEVGSGMGLSLVNQFIENQGGKLNGKAGVNQGCIFTITFPLQSVKSIFQSPNS